MSNSNINIHFSKRQQRGRSKRQDEQRKPMNQKHVGRETKCTSACGNIPSLCVLLKLSFG